MATLELDQSLDTPLIAYTRGPFTLRCACFRKQTSRETGLRSEDYAVVRLEPHAAFFVLCDGVGSSFHGNIASQVVGEFLLHWLETLATDFPERPDQLASYLHHELDAQTAFATTVINRKDINSGRKELERLALSELRGLGTQTNFVCGLIQAGTEHLPEGRVALFWLGDARLRIFRDGDNVTRDLHATWSSREAWSSRDGVVGGIGQHVVSLREIDAVIAHSDGFQSRGERLRPCLSRETIHELIREAQDEKDDDVSFIEIIHSSVVDNEDDLVPELRWRYATTETKHSLYLSSRDEESREAPKDRSKIIDQPLPPRRGRRTFAVGATCLVIGLLLGWALRWAIETRWPIETTTGPSKERTPTTESRRTPHGVQTGDTTPTSPSSPRAPGVEQPQPTGIPTTTEAVDIGREPVRGGASITQAAPSMYEMKTREALTNPTHRYPPASPLSTPRAGPDADD